MLVDEEYEHNTGDVIENRLLWPAIRRADYAAVFTCQAANSHLVPPKEVSLVLDMFCEYCASTAPVTSSRTGCSGVRTYFVALKCLNKR